jgi:hypothetical protein
MRMAKDANQELRRIPCTQVVPPNRRELREKDGAFCGIFGKDGGLRFESRLDRESLVFGILFLSA